MVESFFLASDVVMTFIHVHFVQKEQVCQLTFPTAPKHLHLMSHDLRHQLLGRLQNFTRVDDLWTLLEELADAGVKRQA